MSFWSKFGSTAKTVGKVAETVAIDAAPAAAATFGGPAAGNIVGAVIAEIQQAHAATGQVPNADKLQQSLGMIIQGVVGWLEATGKIPSPKPAPPAPAAS